MTPATLIGACDFHGFQVTFWAIIALVRQTLEFISRRIIHMPINARRSRQIFDSCVLMIYGTRFGLFENVMRYTLKECVPSQGDLK